MKQVQLIGTTIILVAATTAGGAYLWWQSTPQFALLEARNGYLEKNRKKFNKYVDVATLTTGFTEELIFTPAEKTPKLTKLQRVIGLGALHAARTSIDNSLIFQIQKLVNKPEVVVTTQSGVDETDDAADRPDDAVEKVTTTAITTTTSTTQPAAKDEPKDSVVVEPPRRKFTSLLRMAWKKEKARLKNLTFQRMAEFAKAHPDTIINRIFAAPVGGRANAVKNLLAECGFRGKNFKKYRLERKGSKCIAHLTFLSPRINDLVTVKLELERLHEGPFGRYRISRLIDFKRTLSGLNYDTDEQIQGLVAYGLQDLNGQTLADKAKEVFKDIGATASQLEAEDDDNDCDGVSDSVERYHAENANFSTQ
jgi:hypothetical protein